MKAWLEELSNDVFRVQLIPLIDCVFVLLIYFMITGELTKKEGDIAFALPASVAQKDAVSLPIETMIEISADRTVQVEGLRFTADDRRLNELVSQLQGLRKIAVDQGTMLFVNLVPEGETEHERVIDVMDACAAAGVTNLTFSKGI